MSRKRTIAITLGSLAAGAVIATGVTGIASAAISGHDNGGSPGQSARSGADRGETRGPGGPGGAALHGLRGVIADGARPLHGETVVKQADGTFVTIRMVSGNVTAVSTTSITVRAEDGFTATYAVTSDTEVRSGLPARGEKPAGGDGTRAPEASTDTIADVTVGDVAHVVGEVTGSTATADRVMAMSAEEAAQFEAGRPAAPSGS